MAASDVKVRRAECLETIRGMPQAHRVALRDRLVHGVALKSASHPDPGGLTRRRRPARRGYLKKPSG